jgi:prepilin-type processing-associated H-X9-DG protein
MKVYQCPADVMKYDNRNGRTGSIANSSYSLCWGDTVWPSSRGVFGGSTYVVQIRDVLDGTSNSIALSERQFWNGAARDRTTPGQVAQEQPGITTNPGLCQLTATQGVYNAGVYLDTYPAAGVRMSDGIGFYTGFNTVLPPNSPSCETGGGPGGGANGIGAPAGVGSSGVFSASSQHTGGVNVAFVDGSARFITDTIDVGNQGVAPASSGPSKYGVWGALGTIRGGEILPDF